MPGVEGPKYINSPEGPFFHKGKLLYGLHHARGPIAKRGRAVIVEGYTDVIALHAVGVDEAVASMGTSLTEEQLTELRRLCATLVLAFDADQAGQDAALRGMRHDFCIHMRTHLPDTGQCTQRCCGGCAQGFNLTFGGIPQLDIERHIRAVDLDIFCRFRGDEILARIRVDDGGQCFTYSFKGNAHGLS
jgi:hypothetical protein